jgi:anthranilate phosphoribosyltransferase
MISEAIEILKKGKALDSRVLDVVFDSMLKGKLKDEDIADFLSLLAKKGETPNEIAQAAQSLRKHADSLDTGMDLLDTCGTGGDGKATFNISTAAAIVCSLFLPVAKHGNKAVSSKSGSADVLESLGIKIDRKKLEAFEFLKKNNLTFLFAPFYHPAMKYVAPVRKQLGIRTVFNLIGPLCNPFNPKYQVIGVFSEQFLDSMFDASGMLSMEHAIFVSSKDGLDEVSISDVTLCKRRDGSKVDTFEFDPRDFEIYADISAIKGYDAKENAKIMVEVFSGKHNDLKNAIAINAAFGLLAGGVESDLKSAFLLARDSINNKKALEKLRSLQDA